jgi:PAS domain S-box-containing protein
MQGSNLDSLESSQSAVSLHERWRENFLRLVLIGATILGFVVAVISSLDVVQAGTPQLAFVYGGAWIVLLVITIHRWPYQVRAGILLTVIYGIALSGLLENGMRGDGRLFFLGLTIMTAMLVNMRAAFVVSAASLGTIGVVGALVLTGQVRLMSKTTAAGSLELWLVSTLDLALLQTVVLTGLSLFLREFTSAQDRLQESMDALARERTLLRTVIDNLPDAVYSKDTAGRRQLANQADAAIMRVSHGEDALGRTGAEGLPPAEAARVLAEDQEVLRTGRPLMNQEISLEGPDGRPRWLLVSKLPLRSPSGEIVGMVGIDRDITERKRAEQERVKLEEQLKLSQRLESMGRLAGGIAHDINNLLLPILGYSELLLADLPADLPAGSGLAEGLQQIKAAAERTRDLGRRLLAFGRSQPLNLRPVDLRETVTDFGKLLRRTVGPDVELELRLPAELDLVLADVSALEQILMNLVVNAQEAMPSGGRLTIELENLAVDETRRAEHPGLVPGAYVAVRVTDTGVGMDPSTAARIFEPFFTTKSRGSGLGLSTTYGLVQEHGGAVEVSSKPGRGTTIAVFLPRAAPGAEAPPPPPVSGSQGAPRGTETILIVQDSDSVRELISRALARLGYRTFGARNGAEALQILFSADPAVDLLISDLVMPGTEGGEPTRKMRSRRAALKVLYLSGSTEEAAARSTAEDGVSYLGKPFLLEDLARAVRSLLDAPMGASAGPGSTMDPIR